MDTEAYKRYKKAQEQYEQRARQRVLVARESWTYTCALFLFVILPTLVFVPSAWDGEGYLDLVFAFFLSIFLLLLSTAVKNTIDIYFPNKP